MVSPVLSICTRCGQAKNQHDEDCPRCGFCPRTTEEIAKALYLSRGVFSDHDRVDHADLVPQDLPEDGLLEIGRRISSGELYEYKEERLNKLLQQAAVVQSVAPYHLVVWLLKFFAPAIALILGLLVIAWLLAHMK